MGQVLENEVAVQLVMKKTLFIFKTENAVRDIWLYLDRFTSVPFTSKLIKQIHEVQDKRQEKNVEKQALQIRYCINQAKEYNEAAKVVGFATRPNLLYYSMMSLALACVLLKKDGTYSLDKLRAGERRRHGISFITADKLRPGDSPKEILSNIRCQPEEIGTFGLWYDTLTPDSIIGDHEEIYEGGMLSRKDLILYHEHKPFTTIQGKKINAFQILSQLPDMYRVLVLHDIKVIASRGSVKRTVNFSTRETTYEFVIHSALPELLEVFMAQIQLSPRLLSCSSVDCREVQRGFLASISIPFDIKEPLRAFNALNALSLDDTIVYANDIAINEAAAYYLLMYSLSMLVRYYPDEWILLLEKSHESMNLIKYFMDLSVRKFPNFILNEMAGDIYRFEI